MKWYDNIKNTDDVVISTRVRLARNLEGYAFCDRLDKDSSKNVALCVKQALETNYDGKIEFCEIKPDNASKLLVEEHIISPDFANESHLYRALITDKSKNLAIMINEEDHLRIQSIYAGLSLEQAYEAANKADDAIIKGADVAFDEKLGFLTCCPTNLGTGLRASVMLHLPGLSSAGYMKSIVNLMNKIGLTVRGIYGEGSDAMANMYQLSNQITLGVSEADTIAKLKSAANQIVEKERKVRQTMFDTQNNDVADKLWRSYGALKYARKIDTKEASQLLSNIRLAGVCGIIPECRDKNLIKLLFEIMPAHILERFSDSSNANLRDKYRADLIREFLQN